MYTYEVVCVCVCMRKCMCMYMCVCLYVCVCMLCSWMHAYINIKIISNNNASDVTVFITFHCFISSHSPNESWSSVIFLQLMKCGFFLRNLFYSLAWFPFCWPVPLKFPGIFSTWLIQLSSSLLSLLSSLPHISLTLRSGDIRVCRQVWYIYFHMNLVCHAHLSLSHAHPDTRATYIYIYLST